MQESFSLTHHFIVKIHTYRQDNMFQLQGAIIRPANCSDFTHNNNPDTEDNPYGVNPYNAT